MEEIAEPTEKADVATEQAEKAVEDVKAETDKRDSDILAELRAIRLSIDAQTDHHIKHLESHAATPPLQAMPASELASETANQAETKTGEAVNMTIDKPVDMAVDSEKKEDRKARKFGKRGRRG